MGSYYCPKCSMFTDTNALDLHNELNHPKRTVSQKQLEGLRKAQAVRQQRLTERKARAAQLDAQWAGVVR